MVQTLWTYKFRTPRPSGFESWSYSSYVAAWPSNIGSYMTPLCGKQVFTMAPRFVYFHGHEQLKHCRTLLDTWTFQFSSFSGSIPNILSATPGPTRPTRNYIGRSEQAQTFKPSRTCLAMARGAHTSARQRWSPSLLGVRPTSQMAP